MKSVINISALLLWMSFIAGSFADYFPVENGNIWTYSYQSTSTVVVPSLPTTKDSGTVTWDIVAHDSTADMLKIRIRQFRRLISRTYASNTGPGYDSIFSPPRETADTITLCQAYGDSLGNVISFEGATCPFAVHSKTAAAQDSLGIMDTVITYEDSALACIKITPAAGSCYKNKIWSVVLREFIGPVEMAIGWCPGVAGTEFSETRRLVSRDYPTSVKAKSAKAAPADNIVVNQAQGKVECSVPISLVKKFDFAVYSLQGKEIVRQSSTANNRIVWNTGSEPMGIYIIRVKACGINYSRKIWLNN